MTHSFLASTLLLSGLVFVLPACTQSTSTPASSPVASAASASMPESTGIDQSKICEVQDWRIAGDQCKVGQKIAFLPQSWGNEQLPVLFAALNCDLRYQIVSTRGAVTCIYNPIKPQAAAPAASASAASGS